METILLTLRDLYNFLLALVSPSLALAITLLVGLMICVALVCLLVIRLIGLPASERWIQMELPLSFGDQGPTRRRRLLTWISALAKVRSKPISGDK